MHLASSGLELFKLQLLARWSSDVILRYVRESPLSRVTSDYLRESQSHSLDSLLKSLEESKDMHKEKFSRLDDLTQEMIKSEMGLRKELSDLKAQVCHASSPLYVENLKSGAVHRAVGSPQSLPSSWTTPCGWRFGSSLFSRRTDLPEDWTRICDRCLPLERASVKEGSQLANVSDASQPEEDVGEA